MTIHSILQFIEPYLGALSVRLIRITHKQVVVPFSCLQIIKKLRLKLFCVKSDNKTAPMNLYSKQKNSRILAEEKKSATLLIEKMGMPKKELEQINEIYGVSAFQLLELMQYSKYQFVYQETIPAQCKPCKTSPGKINAMRFLRKGA